ncbi:uncharacterized protein EURHEDRAFT_416749 [Aspergillus ruber CBS 135680]|uniref:Uncharacterized protein n=1 Tax=Aspergillus ruber (strain CBS 135680) TaxID=1388766 RepID=A0A017S2U3_ASPRC|nr:uncharacterized protein EURHEDRAFT_416749 [Aspergillus ruber CBS 135680]EYE91136.1 hypothetical protein EURHEDRAFT_416749 [Aspergillus ruber CBS 135680]
MAVDGGSISSSAPPNHGMAQGPVEARSLSSITGIASNPPSYPRNPTQKKLDPLELYIVRVPGSKDVFLSPLKPPTKDSVSAEAINASLYYLHVATPEDEALLHEVEEEREEEAILRREMFGDEAESGPMRQEFARLNNVRRKPVPGGAPTVDTGNADANSITASPPPSLPSQENIPPTVPVHQLQVSSPTPFAKSAPDTELPKEAGHRVQFMERKPTIKRKPTIRSPTPQRPPPTIPNEEPLKTTESGHPAKRNNRWSAMAGYVNRPGLENWKEALSNNRHSLDSRRTELRPPSSHESPRRSPGLSPSRRSHDSRSPDPSPGFHITLIRRDPTHGTQWNVATISTQRLDEGVMDLEISTPGYNRFLAQDEPISLASLGLNTDKMNGPSFSALQALQQQAESHGPVPHNDTPNDNSSQEPPGPKRFRRKLCVSRPLQDEGRGSIDQQSAPRGSIDSTGPGSPPPKSQNGSLSKLKSGYYTFNSPWNGVCTFSTSVNGRSLKCKHMIPLQAPAGFSSTSTQTVGTSPAVTVAEIRFNTPFQPGHLHHQPNPTHLSPWQLSQTSTFANPHAEPNDQPLSTTPSNIPSEQQSPPLQPANPTSKRASLAQILNPNRPRAHTTNNALGNIGLTRKPSTASTASKSSDDPDRLDFSLARERAGGGMRGKSAKLGKLVVEDEGIKMLDLVVAACMGVWWRGYYY